MLIQSDFQFCMMANVSRVITGMAIGGWSTAQKKCRFKRNPDELTFRVSTAAKSMNFGVLACDVRRASDICVRRTPKFLHFRSGRQNRKHLSILCQQFSAFHSLDR